MNVGRINNSIDRHFDSIQAGGDPTNALIAIRGITEENRPETILDSLNVKYTPQQIDLAFNPSKISEVEPEYDDYELYLSSLSSYEKKQSMLSNYIILTTYYEIPREANVSIINLEDELNSTYAPFELAIDEDEDEDDYTILERGIIKQKNAFLQKNTKELQKAFGLDYDKFMKECQNVNNSIYSNRDCENFFNNSYEKLLSFVDNYIGMLKPEIKEYLKKSYENALPIRDLVKNIGSIYIFDKVILELNPIEFQKVLEALENLRKFDKNTSYYSSWFEYFIKNN